MIGKDVVKLAATIKRKLRTSHPGLDVVTSHAITEFVGYITVNIYKPVPIQNINLTLRVGDGALNKNRKRCSTD